MADLTTTFDTLSGKASVTESVRQALYLADVDVPTLKALGTKLEPGTADYTWTDTFHYGNSVDSHQPVTLTNGDSSLKQGSVTEQIGNPMEFYAREIDLSPVTSSPGATVSNIGGYDKQESIAIGKFWKYWEEVLTGNFGGIAKVQGKSARAASPACFFGHQYSMTTAANADPWTANSTYTDSTRIATKVVDADLATRGFMEYDDVLKIATRIRKNTGQAQLGNFAGIGQTMSEIYFNLPQAQIDGISFRTDSVLALNRFNSNLQGVDLAGAPIRAHAVLVKTNNQAIMFTGNTFHLGDDAVDDSDTDFSKPRNVIGFGMRTGASTLTLQHMPTTERLTLGAANGTIIVRGVVAPKGPQKDMGVALIGMDQRG